MTILNGLILSGGESKRMGRDKGGLTYCRPENTSLALDQRAHLFHLLSPFCSKVYISCRKEQDSLIREDLPRIYDTAQIQGPAAGLFSAYRSAYRSIHKTDLQPPEDIAWFVVACDMPLIDQQVIETLIQRRNLEKSATAYIHSQSKIIEPLIAIWEPSALKQLESDVLLGQLSPRKTLEKLECELVCPTLNLKNDAIFTNINSPHDLEIFKQTQ
jgi:molybdopterin-guanine dinucleotide biosynthesis protein A